MAERVDSRTLSTSTLAAGIQHVEQQAVKQEQPDEQAAMQKELEDSMLN